MLACPAAGPLTARARRGAARRRPRRASGGAPRCPREPLVHRSAGRRRRGFERAGGGSRRAGGSPLPREGSSESNVVASCSTAAPGLEVALVGAGVGRTARVPTPLRPDRVTRLAPQARNRARLRAWRADWLQALLDSPGSTWSAAGLENGDVVERINGLDLTSPEKALVIYFDAAVRDPVQGGAPPEATSTSTSP